MHKKGVQKIQRAKLFFSIFGCMFLSLLLPGSVSAHLGGGPPFLKVNGKYCPTNLVYTGMTTLNIPQDYAPETYLVRSSLSFEIDTNKLAIPPEIIKKLLFRWSLYQGVNLSQQEGKYQYGTKVSDTFPQSGSYLIKLEAKPTVDSDFILLDTALVNIIPQKGYKIPAGAVEIRSNTFNPHDTVILTNTTRDPSAKQLSYFWDFDTGILEKGQSIKQAFTNTNGNANAYLYSRVIDNYGLIADTAVNVSLLNNKLKFSPVGYISGTSVIFGKVTQIENSSNNLVTVLIIGGVFICIGAAFFLTVKTIKKKRRK